MANDWLGRLGLGAVNSGVHGARSVERPGGPEIVSVDPATGRPIARVVSASAEDYHRVVEDAQEAFLTWRSVPPPVRGEVVRQLGQALRERKADLGRLVTRETGKIRTEGEGEVQEMIDMADFAVGLSRQLYGRTIASERPSHRMIEQWHPLGPVGVITAFNFPVAVWAWNAMVAAVCGDTVVWKPSPEAPLTALAVHRLAAEVAARQRLSGRLHPLRRRRRRRRRADARRHPAAPDLGHRELPDGRPGRRGGRPPARPDDPRTRREQRVDRHPERRPRPGAAGGGLRRGRDRRPALHDAPPADRPRVAATTASSPGSSRRTAA